MQKTLLLPVLSGLTLLSAGLNPVYSAPAVGGGHVRVAGVMRQRAVAQILDFNTVWMYPSFPS
jgi:hypothetical protein